MGDGVGGSLGGAPHEPAKQIVFSEAHALLPEGEISTGTWSAWTAALKEKTGRKGRGLFMPLRKALTGQEHGPDMGVLLPLIGREAAIRRLSKA